MRGARTVTMGTMTRALTVVGCLWPLLVTPAMARGQQYNADRSGPPPAEVAPGIAQALGKPGFQISNNRSAYCEIWLRTNPPAGARAQEQNVTLPNIPLGALLGAIRFDGPGIGPARPDHPAGRLHVALRRSCRRTTTIKERRRSAISCC